MREKLICFSYYFGLIPFYWLFNVLHHREPSRKDHYLQAVALNLCILFSIIIFAICFGVHSLMFLYLPSLALSLPLELSFYILGVLLIVCFGVFLDGIIAVIMGCAPRNPLYKGIRSRIVINLSVLMMSVQLLIVVTAIFAVIHSSSIVTTESEEAEIYMLYDDMGYIPRRIFTTGFYFESLAAVNRWGQGSVAVVPLTMKTWDDAIANGRLMFVASHGANGYIQLPTGELVGPKELENNSIGSDLQYVYLSGCETGMLHDEWEQIFEPAEVKTFDRLSTTAEHIYWLINKGRKVISTLD